MAEQRNITFTNCSFNERGFAGISVDELLPRWISNR